MKLGHAPSIGTARPELGEGVRMLPHGRYLIFYRDCVQAEKSLAQLFLKPHLDERLVRNVARVRGHLDGIQQVLRQAQRNGFRFGNVTFLAFDQSKCSVES